MNVYFLRIHITTVFLHLKLYIYCYILPKQKNKIKKRYIEGIFKSMLGIHMVLGFDERCTPQEFIRCDIEFMNTCSFTISACSKVLVK